MQINERLRLLNQVLKYSQRNPEFVTPPGVYQNGELRCSATPDGGEDRSIG